MHASAMHCGTVFFECYGRPGAHILDVGSMDVNGSLRERAPAGSTYVGLDLEPGRSVDVVLEPGARFPFADGSFDLAVSTSCFEHDGAFWETIAEIARILRPGGYFYLNAPSNGPYHAFPHDNWRFYPDAGLALAGWTARRGYPLSLVESAILPQGAEPWSDFYAVFRRGPAEHEGPFIADRIEGLANLRLAGAPVTHFAELPEDIRARRADGESQRAQAEALRQAREQSGLLERQVAELGIELAAARAALSQSRQELERAGALVAGLNAQKDEILASRSWKLTAPLRWLGTGLRKTLLMRRPS